MERSCSTCAWWEPRPGAVWGDCRALPPTIDHVGDGRWPEVRYTMWCRAYNYKPAKAPAVTVDELVGCG